MCDNNNMRHSGWHLFSLFPYTSHNPLLHKCLCNAYEGQRFEKLRNASRDTRYTYTIYNGPCVTSRMVLYGAQGHTK
jgi:hypothetical protein